MGKKGSSRRSKRTKGKEGRPKGRKKAVDRKRKAPKPTARQWFGAWMDLGRAQGITTSAAIAIIGALTSDAPLRFWSFFDMGAIDLMDMVGFTIIAIFAHMVPNAYIELGDLPLDSQIKESWSKPIVSGLLKERSVVNFVRYGLIISWISCFIFFPYWQAMLFLALAALWVMWYGCGFGKRIPGSYDFSFSFAYGFLMLFGIYAVGGEPTVYSWVFMGIVITGGTAFAQWENAIKDVDADRAVGVKSFAVLMGVKGGKYLGIGHPFMVYGYILKAIFLIFCLWGGWAYWNEDPGGTYQWLYLLFLMIYGIGSQTFIMWRFLKKRTRLEIRKSILMDVPLAAMIGFSVVIATSGAFTLFLLMVFLIGGYMVGSRLQYGTEFKFGRYNDKYEGKLKKEIP